MKYMTWRKKAPHHTNDIIHSALGTPKTIILNFNTENTFSLKRNTPVQ